MKIPIYLADAFINDTFRGNPAGVCILKGPADEVWMQSVASEMNQAETAFLYPLENGDWNLRWFTPTNEIELCGHATLASGHILATTHQAQLPIKFHTLSGILTVEEADGCYQMDFPSRPATEQVDKDELSKALNISIVEAWANEGIFLVQLESEGTVRSHQPNFQSITQLGRIGVIITAQGTQSDFVSRFYAPNFGVPEDPATGSAHCALAPYWSERLGKVRMLGHQLSKRGGEIGVELKEDRVILSGRAKTFLEGTLS